MHARRLMTLLTAYQAATALFPQQTFCEFCCRTSLGATQIRRQSSRARPGCAGCHAVSDCPLLCMFPQRWLSTKPLSGKKTHAQCRSWWVSLAHMGLIFTPFINPKPYNLTLTHPDPDLNPDPCRPRST